MTTPPRGHRRSTSLGQALVEFALVGPLLLASILACMDGGLLMWSMNAANHSAGVATTIISAEGRQSTADTDAVREIAKDGLGNTPSHIDEIDVYELLPDASGAYTVHGLTNRYYSNGSSVVPWPPSDRVDTLGSTLTYIGLTIKYHYNYVGLEHTPSITLSVSKSFRLEPQQ